MCEKIIYFINYITLFLKSKFYIKEREPCGYIGLLIYHLQSHKIKEHDILGEFKKALMAFLLSIFFASSILPLTNYFAPIKFNIIECLNLFGMLFFMIYSVYPFIFFLSFIVYLVACLKTKSFKTIAIVHIAAFRFFSVLIVLLIALLLFASNDLILYAFMAQPVPDMLSNNNDFANFFSLHIVFFTCAAIMFCIAIYFFIYHPLAQILSCYTQKKHFIVLLIFVIFILTGLLNNYTYNANLYPHAEFKNIVIKEKFCARVVDLSFTEETCLLDKQVIDLINLRNNCINIFK